MIRNAGTPAFFCIEFVALRKFFAFHYKVSADQYVTCINSGVNVTEQRGTPSEKTVARRHTMQDQSGESPCHPQLIPTLLP
jgi:hypothetical protein